MPGLLSSRAALRTLLLLLLALASALTTGCTKSSSTTLASPGGGGAATQQVFDAVVPSVVAVLNDDRAIREDEQKRAMEELGKDEHAPKNIIDVSLRKEPMPHGTGFLVASSSPRRTSSSRPITSS